ncbi:UNVERIFIED_CONTAM: 1-phosphatidylinositol-3-phosphate 5-kinase FAB1B [Sesamum radiatum]|uniref:1-phosphatidylinositol-3-phosphate 5-kinase FAB1B n=1 Tax=Sesamum radiatum TaxID=300843 RepID=A0AAW2R3D2_SESRA
MSEAESFLSRGSIAQAPNAESATRNMDIADSGPDLGPQWEQLSAVHHPKENNGLGLNGCHVAKTLSYLDEVEGNDNLDSNLFFESEASGQGFRFSHVDGNKVPANLNSSELVPFGHHNINHPGELGAAQEDFPPSASDHQSILVSLSTRCVWKGSVCERSHLFRIKYYGNFDKPLGRFLRDHLFDQDYRCRTCDMPSEAHVHCYTHRQGSLTISVKKLEEFLLPGEREGKIWMWHRCLCCPRTNGFPPATRRVVMSDAAWGLSFGKFLELSFSNHAAASRVASCGHSLHRDCLRFYGFGRMVACFRYAPINLHSVYLPPPKLEFDYYKQEWVQKEFDDVRSRANLLFAEVLEVLHQISEKIKNGTGMKATESGQQIAGLELMLQQEKKNLRANVVLHNETILCDIFHTIELCLEESLLCLLKKEVKSCQPELDILEINRLKRQLVFHSYVWDQRLVHVSRSNVQSLSSSMLKEKPADSREKRTEMDMVSRAARGFSSWDSSLANMSPVGALNEVKHGHINSPNGFHKAPDINRTLSNTQDTSSVQSSGTDLSNQSEILEIGKTVRRARSEGQFQVMENTSDNSDVAGTGNHQPETVASKEVIASPNRLPRKSSSGMILTTVEPVVGNSTNDRFVAEEAYPLRSALPAKGPNDMENPSSWVKIPFSALYRSFNKNSSSNAQKLGKISDYNPVYISSFRELHYFICLGVTRLRKLYVRDPEKQKNSLESSTSFSILDSVNLFSLHSFDELPSESLRSLASADESVLSSGSRTFSGLDPLFPNSLHARISFSDDGPPGKVKYTVTCYFAKQFEALRRTCCTSELDFIRSLSRCKKWGAQGGKSNVFFAKTLDDRFIIKQVTKTELESFTKFAPSYFKYLSESIDSGCPTCLAKILGIYQVTSKHLKGGKESRMDVLVMENLLFRRNITRLYDLKGSSRSRYNPDSSGSNKVLLDQNLIEAMPTSPIFLGTKAKRLLERAVWNDTSFLASIDVMDYSLLVGIDEEKHELVLGIIDFMRQYTWDKHLETWVKASGILGGPKNASPTVISPKQYKRRFRKAMSAYFLMVPDEWPSSMILRSDSLSDLFEENSQDRISPQ